MDKYTNERVNLALKSFIKKAKKKFRLDKVLLFGSRARGDWLVTSDVDILLVSDDFEGIEMRERISAGLVNFFSLTACFNSLSASMLMSEPGTP